MHDPIHGHTIRWKYEDGPSAGTSFEHEFHDDGTVAYWMTGSMEPTIERNYEVAQVTEMVFAVSYLTRSGWTLTSILDFDTGRLVTFASNTHELTVQHGYFQVITRHAA